MVHSLRRWWLISGSGLICSALVVLESDGNYLGSRSLGAAFTGHEVNGIGSVWTVSGSVRVCVRLVVFASDGNYCSPQSLAAASCGFCG